MIIHFVTIALTRGVHVQGLGYTRQLYCYGWGKTTAEAAGNVCAYLMGGSIDTGVARVLSSKPMHGNATIEGLRALTFPEQVYGLPTDLLEAEISARMLPASIVSGTLEKAQAIRDQLTAGYARHAEAIAKLTNGGRKEERKDG